MAAEDAVEAARERSAAGFQGHVYDKESGERLPRKKNCCCSKRGNPVTVSAARSDPAQLRDGQGRDRRRGDDGAGLRDCRERRPTGATGARPGSQLARPERDRGRNWRDQATTPATGGTEIAERKP